MGHIKARQHQATAKQAKARQHQASQVDVGGYAVAGNQMRQFNLLFIWPEKCFLLQADPDAT